MGLDLRLGLHICMHTYLYAISLCSNYSRFMKVGKVLGQRVHIARGYELNRVEC